MIFFFFNFGKIIHPYDELIKIWETKSQLAYEVRLQVLSHLLLLAEILQEKSSYCNRNLHNLEARVRMKTLATQISLMFKLVMHILTNRNLLGLKMLYTYLRY